eukprot:6534762-Prymnesium_polylepis.1
MYRRDTPAGRPERPSPDPVWLCARTVRRGGATNVCERGLKAKRDRSPPHVPAPTRMACRARAAGTLRASSRGYRCS